MLKDADIYERSGSHFFRNTTGIQPGPDVSDKSRLIMTFLTNLGVTGISFSFRIVLQWKAGQEVHDSST